MSKTWLDISGDVGGGRRRHEPRQGPEPGRAWSEDCRGWPGLLLRSVRALLEREGSGGLSVRNERTDRRGELDGVRRERLLLGLLLVGGVFLSLPSCRSAKPVPDEPPSPPSELKEVNCVKTNSTCPFPDKTEVCRILVGKDSVPEPQQTCVHLNQKVRLRLADPHESGSVQFSGNTGQEIFKDFPSSRRLDLSRGDGGVYWDGLIRPDATSGKYCFSTGNVEDCGPGDGGTPTGEPGELEVVRDPTFPQ